MSRRSQLFVGRLPLDCREKDIEEIFERYGSLVRCDVKFGTGMAYAFVDYEDKRDAEDAIKYENGRDLHGHSIVVEWARGPSSRPPMRRMGGAECYRCHRHGHWARDCPELERDRYRSQRYSNTRYSRSPPRRSRYSYGRSRSGSGGRFGRRSRTPSQVRSPSYNRSRRPKKRSPSNSASRSRSRSMGKAAPDGKGRVPTSKSASRSPPPKRSGTRSRSRSPPPPRRGSAGTRRDSAGPRRDSAGPRRDSAGARRDSAGPRTPGSPGEVKRERSGSPGSRRSSRTPEDRDVANGDRGRASRTPPSRESGSPRRSASREKWSKSP